MALTKLEKNILTSIVKIHLVDLKKDKKAINEQVANLIGPEAKYERALRAIIKKLS